MTYPIILAHGVCRFDKLWSDTTGFNACDSEKKDNWHYFRGVCTMLQKKGYQVYHSSVSWCAGVETRSRELLDNVHGVMKDSGINKVNIIAHSMGGLDARHMMFNDRNEGGVHQNIASLTTISTPHWGSPFADWGVENLPFLLKAASKLGLDAAAFNDLTVKSCTAFNENNEVREFERRCEAQIQFKTFAGQQDFRGVCDPLKIPFYYIEQREGENDGLVSVQSAKWEDRFFGGVFEDADHMNELGWWDLGQIWLGESDAELLSRIHKKYANIASDLP